MLTSCLLFPIKQVRVTIEVPNVFDPHAEASLSNSVSQTSLSEIGENGPNRRTYDDETASIDWDRVEDLSDTDEEDEWANTPQVTPV